MYQFFTVNGYQCKSQQGETVLRHLSCHRSSPVRRVDSWKIVLLEKNERDAVAAEHGRNASHDLDPSRTREPTWSVSGPLCLMLILTWVGE